MSDVRLYPDSTDDLAELTGGVLPDGSLAAEEATGRSNSDLQNQTRRALKDLREVVSHAGHQARGLHGFHQKLLNRESARVNVMVVGDSRPEGNGVGATVGTEGRWPNLLVDGLRARFPSSGAKGRGTRAAWYGSSDIQTADGPTATGNQSSSADVGLGLRAKTLRADTGSGVGMLEWSGAKEVKSSHVRILIGAYYLGGKAEYEIDGSGSWVEIDCSSPIVSFEFDYKISNLIDLGGPGPHDLKIRFKSVGTSGIVPNPVICGIEEIDGSNASAGFGLVECAHGGYNAGGLLFRPGIVNQWAAEHSVDLVIIDLLTNDWQAGGTLADAETDLQDFIDRLRVGVPDVEIVLFAGWTPRAPLGDPTATWPEFAQVLHRIAAHDDQIEVCNALDFLPQPDAPGEEGYATTNYLYDFLALHPEELGHEVIARGLLAFLTPPDGAIYDESLIDFEWHEVGASPIVGGQTVTFLNGWTDYDGTGGTEFLEAPLRFRKLPNGMVLVEGFVDGSAATDQAIFRLPPGCRPVDFFVQMAYGTVPGFASSGPVPVQHYPASSGFSADGEINSSAFGTFPLVFVALRFLAEA